MIQTVTLKNLTNGAEMSFDCYDFILKSYSFDGVTMQHNKSKTTKQVGATITSTQVATRPISLIGYTQGQNTLILDQNKQTLINVTAPFTEVLVTVTTDQQTYQIETKSENVVKWGENWANNNDMFTMFSISLIAPGTVWKDTQPTTVSFEGYHNNFTFPFYSTSSNPLIFGYPLLYKPISVVNSGGMRIGLTFIFTINSTITGLTITNTVTNAAFILKSTLVAGDMVTICTTFGQKSVSIQNGSTVTNGLKLVDLINSTWLQLEPGNNTFELSCTTGSLDSLTGYMTYTNEYWGLI